MSPFSSPVPFFFAEGPVVALLVKNGSATIAAIEHMIRITAQRCPQRSTHAGRLNRTGRESNRKRVLTPFSAHADTAFFEVLRPRRPKVVRLL
jgi:hypothetical protein